MSTRRTEGALLAGVCSGIAHRLGWNAWALRALFVLFLLVKTVWAVIAYGVLALALQLFGNTGKGRPPEERLGSPELSGRSERIAELERRFRELEGRDPGGRELRGREH
jgi:phage shock protein PspC (stress-responsive transcriptional regulator)